MSDLQIEVIPATFTRRKGELTKLNKQLDKLSAKMVELLESQAYDVTLDPKVRQKAAELVLKYFIETSKTINADNMMRMLADIKHADKLLGGNTSEGAGNEKSKPLVDFDSIIDVTENK